MAGGRRLLDNTSGALLAAAVVLLVFASVLGFIAAGDNVLGADLAGARRIQAWRGGPAETLYRIGDLLGTTSVMATIAVIGLCAAMVMRHVQLSLFLLFTLILRLLGTLLKPLFDSPRPHAEHVRILEPFDGTGYPSGHSITAAMVGTMLILIAWRYVADARVRLAISTLAVLGILLVGWSRIWAGAHWPSDVLGGWSFGIALVLAAWVLAQVLAGAPLLRRDTAAGTATSSR